MGCSICAPPPLTFAAPAAGWRCHAPIGYSTRQLCVLSLPHFGSGSDVALSSRAQASSQRADTPHSAACASVATVATLLHSRRRLRRWARAPSTWLAACRGPEGRQRPWETEEELQELVQTLELPAAPKRLPSMRGQNKKYWGAGDGPSAEEVEAMVEELVPPQSRRRGRGHPGHFDPHSDNPLTKGIHLMVQKKKQLENMICCRGCGVPLQTHDPTNVGYVRFARYLEKWSQKLHRRLLCSRCIQLEKGELVPVVKETLGKDRQQLGFGGHVVPADVLAHQLQTIRQRRCLVVYVVDVLDFNGSFIRRIREIVGRNPVLIIGTKIDLLPPKTDLERVHDWLLYSLRKKKLRVVDVRLVSNETGKGINHAVNALRAHRSGMDVFVVGAANAGKSMFITRLLDRLEEQFPDGKLEECEKPLVSRTPGTTLGTIQLRAFRRSATSPVFASLFDTPGVHQPTSMQNLLDVQDYNRVQPTRAFGVQTVRPAKDVVAELKKSGELVAAESLQHWLSRPVRYLWGFPGQAPVVAIEVMPPVTAMLQLSFVAVHNLSITCEANIPGKEEGGKGLPAPPEGMDLNQVCYVKAPAELTMDGQVLSDLALSGFGWVAVSMSALSAEAEGRSIERSKVMIRVYGPKRLKVAVNTFPMPVGGLPGQVPPPPEDKFRLNDDDDEAMPLADVQGASDSLDEEAKPVEVPPQPWAEGLGRAVGGFNTANFGGGKADGDVDDEAAEEASGGTFRRRSKLINDGTEMDVSDGSYPITEDPRLYGDRQDGFNQPISDEELDDGVLPFDDLDEDFPYHGPSPELGLGWNGGGNPLERLAAADGSGGADNPFGDGWPGVPSMTSGELLDGSRRHSSSAEALQEPTRREHGQRHALNAKSLAKGSQGKTSKRKQAVKAHKRSKTDNDVRQRSSPPGVQDGPVKKASVKKKSEVPPMVAKPRSGGNTSLRRLVRR